MIIVNRDPKNMLRIRFILVPRINEAATIREGIAKTTDAINTEPGLSKLFSPLIKRFILSGA